VHASTAMAAVSANMASLSAATAPKSWAIVNNKNDTNAVDYGTNGNTKMGQL